MADEAQRAYEEVFGPSLDRGSDRQSETDVVIDVDHEQSQSVNFRLPSPRVSSI